MMRNRHSWTNRLLVLLAAPFIAAAADGDLDSTFAAGGKLLDDFGPKLPAGARAMVIQPDGRIVAAGSAGGGQMVLARYTVTGAPDPTFGSAGKVATALNFRTDIRAVTLQSDGKILVAGTAAETLYADFLVARYDANGSLDPSFGNGGVVRTDFGKYDTAEAIAVQADGKIVVGGHFLADPYRSLTIYALARYRPDGSLDPTFGSGGVLTTMVGGSCANSSSQVQALAIQPDGKILAAGYAIVGCGAQTTFAVVRYLANGSLDPSFDLDGKVTRPNSNANTRLGFAGAAAIALQPDGKIIAGGTIYDGGRNVFAVVRYTSAGFADLSFGTDSVVKVPVGTGASELFAVALQADGKIVIGGDVVTAGVRDFGVARLDSSGKLDPGFATNGVAVTPMGSLNDYLNALAIQSDGKIVAAGASQSPAAFALARYGGTPPGGAFRVSLITPAHGGSSGAVTATISGASFQAGATATLRRAGYPDAAGGFCDVLSGGGAMTAMFDLTGMASGGWDVVVTNPDGTAATLPQGFTVESSYTGSTWTNVVGRPEARPGTSQKVYVNFGNTGNNDAVVVVVIKLTFDSTVALGPILDSMRIRYQLPPSSPPHPELPRYFDLDSPDPNKRSVALVIANVVPPKSVRTVPIPNPDCDAEVQARIVRSDVSRCVQGLAGVALGYLPIGPCIKLTLSFDKSVAWHEFNQAYSASLRDDPAALVTFVLDWEVKIAACVLSTIPETEIAQDLVQTLSEVMRWGKVKSATLACGTLAMRYYDSSLNGICVYSRDPNGKAGPAGYGAARQVSGLAPFSYAVFFENVATATAAAQEVVVSDQLDPSKVDLETFSLGGIGFGDRLISPPPGLSEFVHTEDLRPQQPLLVRIEAKLDKVSGMATWRFTSLDPATGEKTLDPLAGFLPPDRVAPEGQGTVMFTVTPKATLANGTTVQNSASIVFDTNAPILTPVWLNTIDNARPVSAVRPLQASQTANTFDVQWTGTDTGSGVAGYTIYVSDNGAPFEPWMAGTILTQATFTGEVGHGYAFYSTAVDNVGNIENPHTSADTGTLVVGCAVSVPAVSVTRGGFRLNASTQRYVQSVILKNTGAAAIQGPLSLVLDTLSANASLFNKTGATACATPSASPYVNVNVGADGILSPGESATVILEFTNPANQGISYTTRTLAGPGGR